MFKKKFFWAQYNWRALPPNAPLPTHLPAQQKFCTWMKILLHYVFG